MHKTLLTSAGCAFVLATSLSAAQTPTRAAAAADASKEVTVTGCLTQGADASHYVLMKASAPATSETPRATGTSGAANEPNAPATGTYNLMGGGDLKPHLGHKVEVTGTPVAPDMQKDTSTAKEPAPRSAMGRGGSEVQGAMNVKSVKMIANTCS